MMEKNSIISQAPGRINIIGEHTDYNDGFVLPAAIDKKTVFYLKKNGAATEANITATQSNDTFTFDLNDFFPTTSGWYNYVMGVVSELQKLGGKIGGFDGSFEGDVPIGAGMSSSAALECGLAFGLNELFDLGFDHWQLVKASQMAEHNFVGIKCGIMDQFASMMGKKNQVMLLDCRSLEFKYFPLDLKEYQLLLLNTKVSHALANSEYNTRRSECEEGIKILQKENPNIKNLRDVSIELLLDHQPNLPEKIFRRCHHVVTENNRVLGATQALVQNDFEKLGELMYQSHYSLQNNYEVSCQELDFLVELTKDKNYVLGSRMMGGGFGGCTINLMEKKEVNHFKEMAAKAYREKFNIDLEVYEVNIENGAGTFQNA